MSMPSSKKRDLRYEFVRSVALILMIGVHVNQHQYEKAGLAGTGFTFMYTVLNSLFLLCNGIYFMLSGRFALSGKFDTKEDIKKYYKNKALKLIFPILVFMFFECLRECDFVFDLHLFREYFWRVWGGNNSTIYWFLYVLVGNILVAPFIGKAFKELGDRAAFLLTGLGLLFNAFVTIGENCGHPFNWGFPLAGWSAYFCLGYCVEKLADSKKKVLIAGIVSVFSLVAIISCSRNAVFVSGLTGHSPLYGLTIAGLFVVLCNVYRSGKLKAADMAVKFIGKYSFAAYMVHLPVMDKLGHFLHLSSYNIGQIFLLIAVTLPAALLLGALLQEICVSPVIRIVEKKMLT